jgi:Na+-driven multidrug efflux pump
VLVILQDYCSNVKARPAFMLLVPVLVFCVLCTLGIVGVKLGADQYEAETRARAQSVAMDWVSSVLLLVKPGCCWSNMSSSVV